MIEKRAPSYYVLDELHSKSTLGEWKYFKSEDEYVVMSGSVIVAYVVDECDAEFICYMHNHLKQTCDMLPQIEYPRTKWHSENPAKTGVTVSERDALMSIMGGQIDALDGGVP